MSRRWAAFATAIGTALMLCTLAACGTADGDPTPTPSTGHESSRATSSPTPSASPSQSPSSSRAAQVAAAQEQYINFENAYIDAGRKKPTGVPPDSLLAMTDPAGPMDEWLRNAFTQNKEMDARVVSGALTITNGPELHSPKSPTSVITFEACEDARALRSVVNGKAMSPGNWELSKVDMRAAEGKKDRSTPEAWRVYSADQLSTGEPCTFGG
ncbi:hypothetical protein FOE78_14565 [Microlunatus elymi]|uniref:Lipoprotein n=1 Tax=Microlunatus elymi TaxID=2596828 RepID=A0A516Q196_9ACTN|nr:hypothetical protein [Microlunatus elymi]QDP96981.1 hypothetical protein FOE78_14565 [Microlunatus elymi]